VNKLTVIAIVILTSTFLSCNEKKLKDSTSEIDGSFYVKRNLLDKEVSFFYRNGGQLEAVCFKRKNGRIEETCYVFFQDGRISSYGHKKHGVDNGLFVEIDDGFFNYFYVKDGKRHGKAISVHPNGTLAFQGNYFEGFEVGTSYYYYSRTGKLGKEYLFDSTGKELQLKLYDINGDFSTKLIFPKITLIDSFTVNVSLNYSENDSYRLKYVVGQYDYENNKFLKIEKVLDQGKEFIEYKFLNLNDSVEGMLYEIEVPSNKIKGSNFITLPIF
jgi:antitoxin component YwqK of YwqJK toxin-antitoxin module